MDWTDNPFEDHVGVIAKTKRRNIRAEGKYCVRCKDEFNKLWHETVATAHYSGDRKFKYGFGKSQKCDDRASAYLCLVCHKWMDGPARATLGDLAHSELFLHYIVLSILQEE